jgi:hypothetical protein
MILFKMLISVRRSITILAWHLSPTGALLQKSGFFDLTQQQQWQTGSALSLPNI